MTRPVASPPGIQRRTIGVLSSAQVFGSLAVGVSTSFGSIVAYEVTESEALAGMSRTVALLGTALFGIPLAALASRFGRRPALSLGWMAAAVGGVLQTAAIMWHSLALLVVGLLVFSIGGAAGFQARFAGADLAEPRHRTRDLSFIMWMTTVGVVVGPNLVGPGRWIASWSGLPPMAGLYTITCVAGILAAAVVFVGLRPDPLRLATELAALEPAEHPGSGDGGEPIPGHAITMREVCRRVLALPAARFALIACALNHVVMVVVMTMTAVFMREEHHGLEVIGISISLHTLGMYAFSPLVGLLADRIGRRRTVVTGALISFVSLLAAMLGQHSWWWLTVGLFGLGLGWSLAMVAGSALLSASVPQSIRARAQGLSDTSNGLVAAAGAGISGPVMAAFGFGWLTALSMALLVPIVVLAMLARRHVH